MTRRSTNQLDAELRRTIDYFLMEGKLTWAEIMGTLEIIKYDLLMEKPIEWTEGEPGGETE